MAELVTVSASDPVDAMLAVLDRDGAVIVADALGEDDAATIRAELEERLTLTEPGSRSGSPMWERFHGANTKRFTGLAATSDAFVHHALLNPSLLAAADHVLLPHAADYWLNTGQVMAIGPGEEAQMLHRDEGNWPEAVSPEREVTVSAMFALGPFTVANGATVVLPGSHLRPRGGWRDPEASAPQPDEMTQAVMATGSALIYTGKAVHGAGANTTDQWRYGMHVSFVAGWLRPEEASPLTVDQHRAAQLPPRARALLGWSSYQSRGGGRTWLVDFEDAERLFA